MAAYELQKLSAETASAFSQLFFINYEAMRQFETGEYFVMFARGSKRVQSILGIEREILIIGNVYSDQQPRSVKFARRLIDESDGRLKYILRLVVRRIVVGNLGTGNVERRFGEAAKNVHDSGNWKVLSSDLKDLNPPHDEFIEALRKRSFNKGVLTFLRRSILAESITPEALN